MKALLVCLLLFFSSVSFAQQVSLVAGMRSNSAESETEGVSVDGDAGFQGGGLVHFDLGESLKARTGLIYTTRNFDAQLGNTVVSENRLGYFDVPVGVEYSVNSSMGVFLGGNGSVNVSKNCGAGSCSGVKILAFSGQIGGNFEIIPRFSIEVYYENGFTKLADDIKNPSSFVAQGQFQFQPLR
jgi:hypothetical protein